MKTIITMRKALTPVMVSVLLSGCTATPHEPPAVPAQWSAYQNDSVAVESAKDLHQWWTRFNDPVLDQLVVAAIDGSPDIAQAQARVLEARGDWRSARGNLFPILTGNADGGRQNLSVSDTSDFYDATFDASYEIDIFGKNRHNAGAAKSGVDSAQASFEAVRLSLVAETVRNYIQYRGYSKQALIAGENLSAQEKTLDLIRQQKEIGTAPQLDVERAQALVNTTRASIQEDLRQADAARLRLGVLTGLLPDQVLPILGDASAPTPGADVTPVLMAPADVIGMRPDIRAAEANLAAQSDLSAAAFAALFPSFTLSGFFGVADNALVSSTQVWSVMLGTAVNLIDFGRIEGRIDAAKAREEQAYQALRKTVLQAVADVETSLSDYARINTQSVSLRAAQGNAHRSLEISQELYKQGEISFLDVLDAQRTAHDADSAVVSAETARALALVGLYKSLGVY
ncbi:MAG: efflux transporter outer membrane subunit [Alphaproteobacteria bacterium]|nr:efflux transporter outer membrane subunit [Alphaproteobacteria bacterium]